MTTVVNRFNSVQRPAVRPRALTTLSYQNGNEDTIDKTTLFNTWPKKSAHVITELLTTEKGYIESIEEVIRGYLKPLYEHLLSASQGSKFIETVFCNLQKLHNIHMDLYISLISSYDNPSEFGQVFIAAMDNFREYILYCTNFPKCEELLQQMMKSQPDTRDFIIHCQIQIGHPLPLITYLHKPVQRILKYRLLLEQTIKGMSDNMKGFLEIKNALDMMSKLAYEVNEVKRKNENLQRVECIQKSLKGLKSAGLCGGDLRSCGSLVFEEKCKVLGRFGGERIIMLFETCLLFLRDKGSQKYVYKWHILIEELDVCEVSGVSNVFKIYSVYKPSQKISVEVKTRRMKDKIVNQIQSVLVKDLKEQENIRTSLKKNETNTQTEQQEHNNNNIEDQRSVDLAYKRSLLATELQSRRRTRQLSTRRWPNTSDAGTESESQKNLQNSISGDSGLGISISSSNGSNTIRTALTQLNEEDDDNISNKERKATNEQKTTNQQTSDDKKLRRRTAVRRKETSRAHILKRMSMEESLVGSFEESLTGSIEPPATVSYSYPLGSENSMMGNSFDKSEHHHVKDNTSTNVETSLDIAMRQQYEQSQDVESSLDKGLRTAEFVMMHSIGYNNNMQHYQRPRYDDYNAPPNPSAVFNGSYNIAEYPSTKETDEQPAMILPTGNGGRLSVSSRDSDNMETSLCSNMSSLSAEDHYYLSTMPSNSSIIAGMDGDNITIYDNDSDDSDNQWSDDDDEQQFEQEPRGDESDMVEKSLRSYLSKAQLWGTIDDEIKCSISPLATLPRMSNNGGVYSLPRYNKKSKLVHHSTVDIFQSLPPSSLSPIPTTQSSPLLTQSMSLIDLHVPLPPPEKDDDDDDVLGKFVLPLPAQSPNDGNKSHRDSWIPPTDNDTYDINTHSSVYRPDDEMTSDDVNGGPTQQDNRGLFENSAATPVKPSDNFNLRNNHHLKDPKYDSGFQSEDLDLMISLVNEIQTDKEFSASQNAEWFSTNKKEDEVEFTSLQFNQQCEHELSDNTRDTHCHCCYKHNNSTNKPYTVNQSLKDPSFHESNEKNNGQPLTKNVRQRHAKENHQSANTASTNDSSNRDNTEDGTNNISFRDAWIELQTAVMAKITFGLVSTFALTNQQTLIVCVVVFLVLCCLYFVARSYYNSERDMTK